MSALAPTLEAFFTERLIRQQQASPNTISAYRDTLRLLLCFAAKQTGKQPSQLDIADLDVRLVAAFLDYLEAERGNAARAPATPAWRRSTRCFASRRCAIPHAAVIERVLAIPPKRFERNLVTFLGEEEVAALLDAPDRSTWTGHRDRAMLMLAAQTGCAPRS